MSKQEQGTTVSNESIFRSVVERKPLVIPPFQRGYAWKWSNCKLLINDLLTVSAKNLQHIAQQKNKSKTDLVSELTSNNPKLTFTEFRDRVFKDGYKHELGCIVLYPDTKENYDLPEDNKPVHCVVDGQQRITTLMLLARAIYKQLPDCEDRSTIGQIKKRLAELFSSSQLDEDGKLKKNDELYLYTTAVSEESTRSIDHILRYGEFSPKIATENPNEDYSRMFEQFCELLKFDKDQRGHIVKGKPKIDRNIYSDRNNFYRNLLWSPISEVAKELKKRKESLESYEELRALFPTGTGQKSKIQAEENTTPFLAFVALNLLEAFEVVVMTTSGSEAAMVMFDRLNTSGVKVSTVDLLKSRIYRGLKVPEERKKFAEKWELHAKHEQRIIHNLQIVERLADDKLFEAALIASLANQFEELKDRKELKAYLDQTFNQSNADKLSSDLDVVFNLYHWALPSGLNITDDHPTWAYKIDETDRTKITNLILAFLAKNDIDVLLPVLTYFLHAERLKLSELSDARTQKFAKITLRFLKGLLAKQFLNLVNTGNSLDYTISVNNALKGVDKFNDLEDAVVRFIKEEIEDSSRVLPDFQLVDKDLKYLALDLEVMQSLKHNGMILDTIPQNHSGVWLKVRPISKFKLNDPQKPEAKSLANSVLVISKHAKRKSVLASNEEYAHKGLLSLLKDNLYTDDNFTPQEWNKVLQQEVQEFVKDALDGLELKLEEEPNL